MRHCLVGSPGQWHDCRKAFWRLLEEVCDPILVNGLDEVQRFRVVFQRTIHGKNAVEHLTAQAVDLLVA